MKARLVYMKNGRMESVLLDRYVVELMAIGHKPDNSKAREKGGCVPRAELDNAPILKGFLSPTWDYGMLRYDTEEVYRIMSI